MSEEKKQELELEEPQAEEQKPEALPEIPKLDKDVTLVELSNEEKQLAVVYQRQIERSRLTLANLRMQYLAAERRTLEAIDKAQVDFVSHLKALCQTKGIPQKEEWLFDPNELNFKKKTE